MKKVYLSLMLGMNVLMGFAVGLVSNTNMSPAYLRMPAREGMIDIDGVYYNPAGTAFLENGFHIHLSIQSAFQERKNTVTFAPFALNKAYLGDPGYSRVFNGKTVAPVIPNVYFAYNWDRWNLQASFNIVGGGGKCKFNDGLGVFESVLAGQAASLGQAVGQNVAYSLNSSVTGSSFQYGMFLGTSFELWKDHIALSVGVQGIYADNQYKGGMNNMQLWMGDDFSIPAWQYLAAASQKYQSVDLETAAKLAAASDKAKAVENDIELDARQRGFGITPVLGIDFKVSDILNMSFRYQFQTVMKLKTKATNSAATQQIAQLDDFQDGKKIRADIPGYFNVGLSVNAMDNLRFAVSYRYFDEKHATRDMVQNANKNNKGTHEPCAGIEWDIFKYLTFSCGYQGNIYGQTDDEMSELDFQLNAHSILVGFRINCGKVANIDLGYMHTFYDTHDVTKDMSAEQDGSLPFTTHFTRKNDVFGVGLNLAF